MTASQRHRIDGVLRRFARARVLVVGDLMLDHFIWGRVERISPEAPVPVVQVTGESVHLGGAANVVHNVRALGGKAAACGIVGGDEDGKRMQTELARIRAGAAGVVVARGVSTIRKTRVIAHNQQIVRFDREHTAPDSNVSRRVAAYLRRSAARFDAIVVSDYGKGAVGAPVLDALEGLRNERGIPVIVDPKKLNYAHYHAITLATPNLTEAAEASGVEIEDERSLRAAAERLLELWTAEAILVTRGERGMTLVRRRARPRHFPATARQVFDVTGAGDTVAATCALALAAGGSYEDAAVLANAAAGIVVTKLGTATATPAELRAVLRA